EWFRFLFMGLFMAAFLICSYISFPPFTITTPEMIRTVNSHIYWIVTGLLFYQILAIYYLYKIVIKDLVEKKQEIFKAKEKAEENDRLKSAFLANISHEIRTPMNVVMGFSDQLLEKEVSREDRIEYAEIINSSSQRLLDIVNDILDLSKIETNQIEVENKAVNLSQLLEELHYLFRQMADEKKLQFVLDDDLGKGDFYCITDEVKIRQILINFLSNAIKYSESGQIQLKCRLLGEHIEFCVKDTGIGIPREFQQVIFDRFRQIETHMSKGTGLGLAISKGLAELLNGKVCVNSVEGKGSSFFLNIPYISIQESLIVNGNSASNKLAINFHHFDKKRILIAEDELLNFKLLEVIFKDLNVEIVWVQNGVEAVKKVDEESFDIVLMDVKMPVMDGLEASRKIRITHPHLYIVAQSAFAYKEDQELAIEAGCDYYLTKPIDKDKLLSVIYNPVYLRENIQMDK
ncbi:MAG: ATP-binding protein, partial [Bacteroidota bacterium]